MTNTIATQPKWTIWRVLGLALMGAGVFHLMASLLTGQSEFPLGVLLTLHWGLFWLRPTWLVKLIQDQPWFELLNALPACLGILVLLLGADKLPFPVDLHWTIFIFYAINMMDSFEDIKKEKTHENE